MPTPIVAEPGTLVPTTVPTSGITNITTYPYSAQPTFMPTPVPTPATVDTWMKINPYFDWTPILGIPLWVFIGAFLCLILVCVIGYWMFRLKRLQSVKGYVEAVAKATQEDVMTWIISTTRNLTIECLRKRDSVLSYYEPRILAKWTHTNPMAVIHIGGKGGVIASEDFYRTRDMVSEIALCNAFEQFNANQEELSKKNHGESVNPIMCFRDYEDYGRSILESLYPDGLEIPAYNIYDPNRFRRWFPKGLTATLEGGVIIREARKLNLVINKPTFWEKVLPLGFICAFAIICVVAAWMCPLG